MQEMLKRLRDICTYHDCISGCPLELCGRCLLEPPPACWDIEKIAKAMKEERKDEE